MEQSFPMAFGRYELLERLAIGGMAELFKATMGGAHNFHKRVVIKKILPQLASDDEFVAMFIDEAKITAQLMHPKIVQVFELGTIDSELFIAMELVDGLDVLKCLRYFAKRRAKLPTEIAIHVAHEVLDALDYAHSARDDAGVPLGIVHRDISPGNILLSRKGSVKLTDFGIARAAANRTKTEAGILKGKYSYMSPEQVVNVEMDYRSDLFAVGVVLCEMLMGRRLFVSASDLDVLIMVRDVRLERLDKYGSHIPAELRAIIDKALTRDPADRFQSARLFRDALGDYLFSQRKRVDAHAVAKMVMEIQEQGDAPDARPPTGVTKAEWEEISTLSGPTTRRRQLQQQEAAALGRSEYDKGMSSPDEPPGGMASIEIDLESSKEIEVTSGAVEESKDIEIGMPAVGLELDLDLGTQSQGLELDLGGSASEGMDLELGEAAAEGMDLELDPGGPASRSLDLFLGPAGPTGDAGASGQPGAVSLRPAGGVSEEIVADDAVPVDVDSAENETGKFLKVQTLPEGDMPAAPAPGLAPAPELALTPEPAPEPAPPPPPRRPAGDEQGDFADKPPLSLLYQLAADGSTGLLEVELSTIHKEAYFIDGAPQFVESNVASERLGEFLVGQSKLSDGELAMALSVLDHFGGKLADTLIGLGLMNPLGAITALTEQVRHKVVDVCTWQKGTYRWFENRTADHPFESLSITGLEICGAGAQAQEADFVKGWAAWRSENTPQRVPGALLLHLDQFALGTRPREVYHLLDGSRTLGDLDEEFGGKDNWIDVLRVIYLLVQAGMIAV